MVSEICSDKKHSINFFRRYVFSYSLICPLCSKSIELTPTYSSSIMFLFLPCLTVGYLWFAFIEPSNFSVWLLFIIWLSVSLIARSKMIFVERSSKHKTGKMINGLNIFYFVFLIFMALILSELFLVNDIVALGLIVVPLLISPPIIDIKKDQIVDFGPHSR